MERIEVGLFREDGGTSVIIAERLKYTASYGILRLFVKSFFTAPMVAHGHLTHPSLICFKAFALQVDTVVWYIN